MERLMGLLLGIILGLCGAGLIGAGIRDQDEKDGEPMRGIATMLLGTLSMTGGILMVVDALASIF